MVKQNLAVCLLFSALGGLCKVLATIVLIIPDDREKQGIPVSTCTKICAVVLNLVLQAATGGLFTVAPMFGPVSLYTPISISAVLLSNMFILWLVLRRETFSKEMRVATLSCVLAVIVLPVVGPATQDDQDVAALLSKPSAMVWSFFITGVFVISCALMFMRDLRKVENAAVAETTLFGVNVFASVLTPTMARAMVIVRGMPQLILIAAYIVIQPILGFESMLESVAVPSRGKFVPMCSAGTVLLNAITGIIIWDDWGVTYSQIAYICILLQILLSVYLLSDHDFFKQEEMQTKSITRRAFSSIISIRKLETLEELEEEYESGDSDHKPIYGSTDTSDVA